VTNVKTHRVNIQGIHLKAQLLADMLELLNMLLPEEHCGFLDKRDVEMFALEMVCKHVTR
jgi:hypothetical protein